MSAWSAATTSALGALFRKRTTRCPGSRSASLRNGFCRITIFHSSGVRTKKSTSSESLSAASDSRKALELSARSHLARENEIAALEQRSGILEADLRYEIAQIGHADLPVAADVDAAEQGDVSCQREPSAVIDTPTT